LISIATKIISIFTDLKNLKALFSNSQIIHCDVFQPVDLRPDEESRQTIVVGWLLHGRFPVSAVTDRSAVGTTSCAGVVTL
jgi:hypothetical protein